MHTNFLSKITTASIVLSMAVQLVVTPAFAVDNISQMEYLNRGTVAVNVNDGVYLSWRLLGTENYDTAFDIYRDNTKITTVTDSTNYTDTTVGTSYTVVPSGESVSAGETVTVQSEQYITISLDRPEGGTSLDGEEYTYSPNDVTPADVDGDGEYELILKWEPSNSFDSGKDAKHNGNVYIDCYKLNGTKLWRIDMGININAGAHFTQMAAYDFDLDGKAELAMKTAPGTKDGQGNYVSAASSITEIQQTDNSADYRCTENGSDTGGRVLSGDEYYTVFQGDTGTALDTVFYPHPRGTITEWGDNWGNRSERYLTGVAYLDGETPSMLAWRGYYAKTTVTAYNLVNKKLVQVADFDTSKNGYSQYAGNGNHNLTVGDVDSDGYDEIICGSLALDNDFSVLWCSGRGHGDALHLADYDPTHEGMEYFSVHEEMPYGMTLYDAETGEALFHQDADGDTGRGMMAHVGYTDGYFELWGAGNYASYGGNLVEKQSYTPDSTNQRIFWDGNLYDELLDGTGSSDSGSQIKISGKNGRVQTLRNVTSNNGTKNNACLIADLFGDWREEIVARGTDNASLLVYTTTIPTEHKLYTLMHDRAYRMQVAAQNAGYNQPPHISYYVSDENDKYDMRKYAAYISTVHNGETTVRTANMPANTFDFKLKIQDNEIVITNKIKQKTYGLIYIAKYDGGVLTNLNGQEVEIPADGYSVSISADIGDVVYLWDKNQKPLADKLMVQPAPTQRPTPVPTASPTPKPTATPKATQTPIPIDEFEIINGVVYGYNGNGGTVTVPSTYDGMEVTWLTEQVFENNENIKEVILPDTINTIDSMAFANCSGLEKITLPKALTGISSGMFSNCSSLNEIILPDTVTCISAAAFAGCGSLTTINLENVTIIGNLAFTKCTALEEVTFGGTTTSIGTNAFQDCNNIKEITVYSMDTSLDTMTYLSGDNITIYGFTGSNAEKFAISSGIAFVALNPPEPTASPAPTPEFTVEDGVLTEYNGTDTDVVIPEEIDGETITSISSDAFGFNEDITSVTIPDTVTSIESGTFFNCYSLESVKLPAGLEAIPEKAFQNCTSLTEVTFPSALKIIGYKAFANCEVLTDISGALNSVTEIDSEAFSGCVSITEAHLPETLKELSYDMFYGCTSLFSVTLPSTITEIPEGVFEECSSLTEITLPESVTKIGNSVFSNCTALEAINLEKISEVGKYAFYYCTSLEEIRLDSAVSVGSRAFFACTSIREVYFGEEETTIPSNAFTSCGNVEKVTVLNMKTDMVIEKNDKMVVYGYVGSSAQLDADRHDIPFYNLETGERVTREWIVSSSGTLYGYKGTAKDIVIPSKSTEGVTITGIFEEAFFESDITSVEMSDSVEIIYTYAFVNCESLKTVRLSAGMTKLNNIFSGCSALESVYIPSSIAEIAENVFADCPNVTIYCESGSYAETYAKENNICFEVCEIA